MWEIIHVFPAYYRHAPDRPLAAAAGCAFDCVAAVGCAVLGGGAGGALGDLGVQGMGVGADGCVKDALLVQLVHLSLKWHWYCRAAILIHFHSAGTASVAVTVTL